MSRGEGRNGKGASSRKDAKDAEIGTALLQGVDFTRLEAPQKPRKRLKQNSFTNHLTT